MNYYTTREQAIKLAKIVSDDTADMSYIDGEPTLKPYTKAMIYVEEHKEILPCWSAGRVMQLLPSAIEVEGKEYFPEWRKTVSWGVFYVRQGNCVIMFKIGDLIEICIAMLEDLKEGGYLDE